MAYLVIWKLPNYPETETGAEVLVASLRHPGSKWTYDETVAALEKVYPGAKVYTPMEQAPRGTIIHTVYLSHQKDGVGRVGYNMELWAVEPRRES